MHDAIARRHDRWRSGHARGIDGAGNPIFNSEASAREGTAQIMNKYDHVRSEIADAKTGIHQCHWTGCNERVAPAAWGCRRHWFMLPMSIRNKIWAAYRRGQERTKKPSAQYIAAAREARDWIAANHPKEEKLL